MSQVGVKKWGESFSFAISRHPYELIKSWYCHHKLSIKHKDTEVGNFYPNDIKISKFFQSILFCSNQLQKLSLFQCMAVSLCLNMQ